jgi:hypothetical protein
LKSNANQSAAIRAANNAALFVSGNAAPNHALISNRFRQETQKSFCGESPPELQTGTFSTCVGGKNEKLEDKSPPADFSRKRPRLMPLAGKRPKTQDFH